jgi:recombination protein RecA
MPSASALRLQIETALAQRIPSALTPAARVIRPVAPTGVPEVDALLEGGLPVGAITEMVGPECSGRTSLALSFVAGITRAASVGAWIDVSNTLDPESAAAAGVDLARLLWVRCGAAASQAEPTAAYRFALPEKYLIPPPVKQGLHGGGCGGHPRNEVKGLAEAVTGLLRPEALAPRCAEPQRKVRSEREVFEPTALAMQPVRWGARAGKAVSKPWPRMEQALRAADLLLQAGGFSVVVLDMASLAPEHAARVPLATWFRYRAAAERTQASVLLLTQHSCAKSSGELLLRFEPGRACSDEATVFTGSAYRLEVERHRFSQTPANVVPLRKPPKSVTAAEWRSQCAWAGPR